MHIGLGEETQISKQQHAFWEVELLCIVSGQTQYPEETEALKAAN